MRQDNSGKLHVQWMSEIQTSLNFGQWASIRFPSHSVFRQFGTSLDCFINKTIIFLHIKWFRLVVIMHDKCPTTELLPVLISDKFGFWTTTVPMLQFEAFSSGGPRFNSYPNPQAQILESESCMQIIITASLLKFGLCPIKTPDIKIAWPGLGPSNERTLKIIWILVRFLDC